MRLRITAEPQLLETTSPSRGAPSHPGELTTTTPPSRRRVPSDRTLRKSRELRRDSRVSRVVSPDTQAASRLRPLERRFLMVALPARVRIR